MRIRHLLAAYAVLNAVLYSMLLPLWEGFDEAFHFAYVQHLANGGGLPDPRTDRLSQEVAASLALVPASHVMKRNLPRMATYADYFSLSPRQRQLSREQLARISPALRHTQSDLPDYEAHHAPLAYLILALPESILADVPIGSRVLVLRIFAAACASLLLLGAGYRLCDQLGVSQPYRDVALFCLLSSQMTWGAIAHVANDWLAIPLASWTLVAFIKYYRAPIARNAALTSLTPPLGLLTKAYFLAFTPVLFALPIVRRRPRQLLMCALLLATLAGPWYARNIWRYRAFTGMLEARAGIGLVEVLRAAPATDWPSVIPATARAALWTGNNTFNTFSRGTLNLTIGVCLVALFLWAATRHSAAEWIAAACCGLFLLALAYDAVQTHVYTRGAAAGPGPWLAQPLILPLLTLLALGLSRWPRTGKWVGGVLILLFGYLLAATYVAKLIPLYGGYEGRGTAGALLELYSKRLPELATNLSSVALAPAWLILLLAGVVVVWIVAQQRELLAARLSRGTAD